MSDIKRAICISQDIAKDVHRYTAFLDWSRTAGTLFINEIKIFRSYNFEKLSRGNMMYYENHREIRLHRKKRGSGDPRYYDLKCYDCCFWYLPQIMFSQMFRVIEAERQ